MNQNGSLFSSRQRRPAESAPPLSESIDQVEDRPAPKSHSSCLSSQLAQSLTSKLLSNDLDCLICVEAISRRSRIWKCVRCFLILHESCVSKWYESKEEEWRCPGCMFVFLEAPDPYSCFCGKVRCRNLFSLFITLFTVSQLLDPDPSPFLIPHSCGNTCGKLRGAGCPHPCSAACHPGPCGPCSASGSIQTCPCGHVKFQLRCGESVREVACRVICMHSITTVAPCRIRDSAAASAPSCFCAASIIAIRHATKERASLARKRRFRIVFVEKRLTSRFYVVVETQTYRPTRPIWFHMLVCPPRWLNSFQLRGSFFVKILYFRSLQCARICFPCKLCSDFSCGSICGKMLESPCSSHTCAQVTGTCSTEFSSSVFSFHIFRPAIKVCVLPVLAFLL